MAERLPFTEALREAALAVSTAEGEHVFDQLVSALARILGVEYALISVYVEPQRSHLRTLATLVRGSLGKSLEYPVAGTPCEQALGRAFGFYAKGVASAFPRAALLAEHAIEGYAATTLHDVDGAPVGVLIVMSRLEIADPVLTETMLNIFAARVSAEIGRRRSEGSYRAIFENAETCILVHDIDSGAIVDVNPKVCATYGYSADELRRTTVDDISSGEPPYTGEQARQLLERARGGEVVRGEWHRRNKDGSLHWDEFTLKRVEIAGKPHILAATREITARKGAEDALRASEEQYRAIFNASTDSLTLRDAQFRIVDVNAAYERMSGLRRADVLGIQELTVDLLDVRDWRHEVHERALAGEAVHLESEALRRDGARLRLEVLVLPMQYRGAPHALYVTRDITERKQAEAALRASEEQYRSIFNAAADALVLRDAQFRIVDVNAAYEAVSGMRREQVIGLTDLTLTRNATVVDRRSLHEEALGGKPVYFEADGWRLDGTPLVLEVRGVPMTYRGERHVLYIGRDATEAKLAERALRASEEQYRAIFNAAADGLVLRDADYRVVDVNRAYEPMSGLTRREMIGTTDALLQAEGEREGMRLAVHRRALAGEALSVELDVERRDGKRFRMDLQVVPMQYRGAPHVLYIGRDITERKRAEAERAQLEAQLRQAQKMEAIGQLTGGIAHDFNNILQGILGNLVLAGEREAQLGDAKLGRYLERAHGAAQRARDLIRQMLIFSRGRSGERRLASADTLIAGAARLLRPTLPATIELETSLAQELPGALLDTVQYEQVLLNLCINARDAMHGAGRIALAARLAEHRGAYCASCRERVDGSYLEISVRDSGPGIAPEVLDRMFDPFFSTKEVGKGSGMGLAMVHGIVHQHGGHVLVESAAGAGAAFRVLIPPAAQAAAPAGQAAAPARKAQERLQGRALVAEDEASIRELLEDLLGAWGLELVVCADGATARDAFAQDPQGFDLVLTDQTMPRLTGMQLARLVTRQRPGIPVILCTGYGEELAPQELEAAGVRTLAKKPFEPGELRRLVQSALQTRNKAPT